MMNWNARKSINPMVVAVLLPILFNFSILFYSIFAKVSFGGSASYGSIAYNLVENGMYSVNGVDDTFSRPPLYPLLLALPRALSDQYWHVYARSIQCLMSIMCSLMVFRIASRISGSGQKGLLAQVLYLAHLASQAEHYAQRETVLFELFLLLFVYVLSTRKVMEAKSLVIASLLSSALYLTRPTGIVFLAITLSVVFFRSQPDKRLKYSLISIVVFVVCIFPWQLYNYRTFSKVTVSSSNSTGLNLYLGASPAVQSIAPHVDIDRARQYVASKLSDNGIEPWKDEYRVNSFLMKEAKKLIVQHPGHFFKKMFKQFFAFYSQVVTPFGRGRVVVNGEQLTVEDYRFVFGAIELNHFVMMTVILPFGMFELVRIRGRGAIERNFKVISFLIFLFFTVLHMITFAETRFRLPLDGLLCVATGLMMGKAIDKYHSNESKYSIQKGNC